MKVTAVNYYFLFQAPFFLFNELTDPAEGDLNLEILFFKKGIGTTKFLISAISMTNFLTSSQQMQEAQMFFV